MDIGRSFTFVTEDKNWIRKIAIGGVVTLIPIVNLISSGYGLRVLRNVAEGRDVPLPEWDDWGGDFIKGLTVIIASLIYSLPAILLSGLGGLIAAVASNNAGDVQGAAGLLMTCTNCLGALWGVAVGLWMPAAIVHWMSRESEFSAFFDFAEIWALINRNLGGYATAIVITIIASIVGGLGVIACIIGVIFTMFYATLVGMHALGQFAREAGAITGSRVMGTVPPYPPMDDLPPAGMSYPSTDYVPPAEPPSDSVPPDEGPVAPL